MKLSVLKELMEYLGKHKKLWLIPIIIILVLFALLIILAEGSFIAPFIYTIF